MKVHHRSLLVNAGLKVDDLWNHWNFGELWDNPSDIPAKFQIFQQTWMDDATDNRHVMGFLYEL